MHHAFEFGSEGPIYEFEFYDGTPLDLEEMGAYMEPRKILLKPRRKHIDKELHRHMQDIQRDFKLGHYPAWIMITATYRDQLGQEWIRGFRQEKGEEEPTDYIFNATFWSWV